MGEMIELEAGDGHRFAAYRAAPAGRARGGLVVIQEIFGLTGQMRRCAERFAESGYLAILPALFDRKERGVALGYTDFQKGGKLAMSIAEEDILADVEACRIAIAAAGAGAIVGYCWGGTVAYLAACRLPFACAVSYYGSGVGKLAERMHPKIPVMYHFGEADAYIPSATREQIRRADPGGQLFVYAGAGHGFACDDREGHHPAAAALAEERTLAFIARHC